MQEKPIMIESLWRCVLPARIMSVKIVMIDYVRHNVNKATEELMHKVKKKF